MTIPTPGTGDSLLGAVRAHLPRGRIWAQLGADTLGILGAFADELARLRADIISTVDQIDPGTATYALPEWAELLGLPDACLDIPATTAEQQRLYRVLWTARGRAVTGDGLVALAEELLGLSPGTITWSQPAPYQLEFAIPGTGSPVYFELAEDLPDWLVYQGFPAVECVLRRYAHARDRLIFTYT